ncbi:hypothetical protein BH09BAC5_BH09BAC5_01960 [soil metagenome]
MSTLYSQSGVPFVRSCSIMMNSSISGNCFGTQFSPSVSAKLGNHFGIGGGMNFNKNFKSNTGFSLMTEYLLMSEKESTGGHLKLSVLADITRMYNQTLSSSAIGLEEKMAFNMKNDETARFNELYFNGWQTDLGFGCAYQFEFGMLLRADFGYSYYITQQQNHPEINLFREKKSGVIKLGFGIGWRIDRKTNSKVSRGGHHSAAHIL